MSSSSDSLTYSQRNCLAVRRARDSQGTHSDDTPASLLDKKADSIGTGYAQVCR